MATQRASDPSANLGVAGRQLWSSILRDYDLRGAGELAVLAQAAKAIDTAEECGAIIERDGPVIQGKTGPRDHPLIRHQLSARALACRLLQRLGVVAEVKRRVGRPGYGGIGVTFQQLSEYDAS